MAAKKDFSGMNTGSRVYNSIQEATGTATTPTAAAMHDPAADFRTQGRKGCKAPRINMAFSEENYLFIRTMARASGKTMTEFTNLIIASYQREHPELMDQAKAFLDAVNTGALSSLMADH